MPEEQVVTPPIETQPPPDLAAIQAELSALKTQVSESQRAAEFWQQKANEKPEPKPKATAAEEDDDPDPLDVITKGWKSLEDVMRKRGWAKADEVDVKINSRTRQLTEEAKLVKQYPDLEDNNSEFFKATALEYGKLTREDLPKDERVPHSLAMRLAAEKAELRLIREGKIETPQQTTERKKKEQEDNRQARIKAQNNPGNARGTETEESDDLTPEQEQVAVRMLTGLTGADGKAYTKEQAISAYKARAKAGVSVKGGIK